MKPQFKTRLAWDQAQLLMQPALIRVLDNIRKNLDVSSWRGSYQDVSHPIPGYILCLTKNNRKVEVDIWQLCYQVCFQNYTPTPKHIFSDLEERTIEVEIDVRLIDETGDLDWQLIEAKAQQVVRQVFDNLGE